MKSFPTLRSITSAIAIVAACTTLTLTTGCGDGTEDTVKGLVEEICAEQGVKLECTELLKVKEIGDEKYAAKAQVVTADGSTAIGDITYEIIGDNVQVFVDADSFTEMK